MAGESVEYGAFRQLYNTLSTGIRAALPSLAEVAFSRGLIHDNTHNEAINVNVGLEVRTPSFLCALRDRIRTDPSAFHRFVDILNEEKSMEYLATIMKDTLQKERRSKDLIRKQIATHDESEATLVGEVIPPGRDPVYELHTRMATKPTKLPISHASNSNNYYRPTSFNEMHKSGKQVYPTYFPGPRSEPFIKHTASPAMAFSTISGPRVAESDSTGEFDAPTRRAITPDCSRKISVTGPLDGDTTKMFRRTYTYR